MGKSTRPPQEILDQIEKNAVDFRKVASDLSARIQGVEELLGKLPGRVETKVFGDHPDYPSEDACIALRLHRSGKDWRLSYTTEHSDFPEEKVNEKFVVDAPVAIKLAIVKMLPDLLEAIEHSQVAVITAMLKASLEVDTFAAVLGARIKEGK